MATSETTERAVTAEELAEMLRRRRAALGLTQEQAAERADVPLMTWKRWESHAAGAVTAAARLLSALDAIGVETRFRTRERDRG